MYAYIKGILTIREETYIVVENNGIGYLIMMPFLMAARIGNIGEEITCFVYQSVKEDGISLYGFASREEKDMFLMLIAVSGIGPKVGQNICCYLTPEQLASAVINNDTATISSVKGLGKKTAERIILELRDKLKAQAKASGASITAAGSGVVFDPSKSDISNDAIGALVMLGYKQQDAENAVTSSYEDGLDLQELIKRSLKMITGNKFG
ncbi:Holliday junction DNA helicase subunit RuvA [Ruminococcaceae bacterium YRB3002]|nr:Holliday junction DNA helicase subunit RuvA [Ruminococcaceae bacterium YRB3002]